MGEAKVLYSICQPEKAPQNYYCMTMCVSAECAAGGGEMLGWKHIQVKYGVRSPTFIWAPCHVMCTDVVIGWDPRNSPLPPHLGSYTRGAIGQQRQTTYPCNPPGWKCYFVRVTVDLGFIMNIKNKETLYFYKVLLDFSPYRLMQEWMVLWR